MPSNEMQAVCLRDFDAPFKGTTTYYKAEQPIDDQEEIDYLISVSAPIKFLKKEERPAYPEFPESKEEE